MFSLTLFFIFSKEYNIFNKLLITQKELLLFQTTALLSIYFTFLLGIKNPKTNHMKTTYGKRFIGQAGIGHKLL